MKMPNSTKAKHPSQKLDITFTEEDHSYIDTYDAEYISVTTLIHKAFPAFDGAAAAQKKSARTGIPAEQYLQEWDRIRDTAAENGTRTHENCERQILGRYDEMHQPKDDEERMRFRAAWYAVEDLRSKYRKIEPEKLVFSPRFLVAGSIDLLCQIDEMNYEIGDWKFVKTINYNAFGNRTGIHPATVGLPDCNFYHYALQLNIYKMILKIEGYIPMQAKVTHFLKRYNSETHTFEQVNLPDLSLQAMMLLAWNVTNDNLENIPF